MSGLSILMESVRAAYSESPRSQKKMALAERDLWFELVREHRFSGTAVPSRREWFRETFREFSISAMETDRRSRILARGELAEPVWALLDAGRASMDSACNALVEAEKDPDPAGRVAEFVAEKTTVKEGFYEASLPSGKTMTRRLPRRGSFDAPTEEFDVTSSRRATAAIREIADKLLESRIGDIEDYGMRKTLAEEFEFAIRVACDDLMKGIQKLRTTGLSHTASRKVSIRASFEVLGIAPPRRAMTDEDRARAYNAYRKLAKTYHPDRNLGDEAAAAQFRAVNVAWDAIKEHRE